MVVQAQTRLCGVLCEAKLSGESLQLESEEEAYCVLKLYEREALALSLVVEREADALDRTELRRWITRRRQSHSIGSKEEE